MPMKIAVLILTHKNAEQAERLANRLQHPDVSVFIHADKKSILSKYSFASYVSLIKDNVSVFWGDFSPVQATLNSMKEIKEKAEKFDYFILLSGQDYPIKPIENLLQFLEENKHKEFINYYPVSKEGWKAAMGRYEYFHYRRNKNILYWSFFAGLRLLMKAFGLKRKPPVPVWAGSQWFNISNGAFIYILDYILKHPGYIHFMKLCNFTDEMFFQTILLNSPFKNNCVNDNLRYIKWNENFSEKIRSPKVLRTEDRIAIQQSEAFFARKFDMDIDKEILDKLDQAAHERS